MFPGFLVATLVTLVSGVPARQDPPLVYCLTLKIPTLSGILTPTRTNLFEDDGIPIPPVAKELGLENEEEFVITETAAASCAENNDGYDNFEICDDGCINDANIVDGAGITIVRTIKSAIPNEIRLVILPII